MRAAPTASSPAAASLAVARLSLPVVPTSPASDRRHCRIAASALRARSPGSRTAARALSRTSAAPSRDLQASSTERTAPCASATRIVLSEASMPSATPATADSDSRPLRNHAEMRPRSPATPPSKLLMRPLPAASLHRSSTSLWSTRPSARLATTEPQATPSACATSARMARTVSRWSSIAARISLPLAISPPIAPRSVCLATEARALASWASPASHPDMGATSAAGIRSSSSRRSDMTNRGA